MSYTIIDPNMPPARRVVAQTPYTDVAQIMAHGYATARYGGQKFLELWSDIAQGEPGLLPVEVRDDQDNLVHAYGIVNRPTIGRLG